MTYVIFDGHNSLHRFDSVIPETVPKIHGQIFKRYYRYLKHCLWGNKCVGVLVLDSLTKERKHPLSERLVESRHALASLFRSLGMSVIEAQDGEDADSLIGKIIASLDGYDILIESGDKDFAQLVTEGDKGYSVSLLRWEGEDYKIWDRSSVIAKWGVTPEQFVDYLTMVGDPSDNIRGVDGIGEKTARKLLAESGTIENIVKMGGGTKATLNLTSELLNGGVEARRKLLTIKVSGCVDMTPPPKDYDVAIKLLGSAGLSDIAFELMSR